MVVSVIQYDAETGFYYVSSRYYDPEIGRWINADGFVSTGQDIIGFNMFSYCGNNPVNRTDPTGTFWKEIGTAFKNAWNSVKKWANDTFGAGSSINSTTTYKNKILPEPLPIVVETGISTSHTIKQSGDSSKPISVYANGESSNYVISSSAGVKINASKFTLDISLGLDNIGITGSVMKENTTKSLGLRLNLSNLKVGIEGATAIQWDNTTQTHFTNVSASGYGLALVYLMVMGHQQLSSSQPAYQN